MSIVKSVQAKSVWNTPSATTGQRERAVDLLIRLLSERGVRHIFSLPGGPIGPLSDALLDASEIESIVVRHENNAVMAAAGYALVSRHLGVVAVTSGPGILNGINGLASAYCDGIPVLVLVGEVPRHLHGKHALQDGDHLSMRNILGSITKWTAEVPDAGSLVPMVAHAMAIALSGRRGPVALTLPMDILTEVTTPTRIAVSHDEPSGLAPIDLGAVIAAIHACEKRGGRGLVFVGSGVRWSYGPERLRHLAERLRWPVMTTPKGKGVFAESHALSLGVFGAGGHPSAAAYVDAGVDTMLALGTSLGDLATDGWTNALRPEHTLIHVDRELCQIGRNYSADIAIAAPVSLFAHELYKRLMPRTLGRKPMVAETRSGVVRHENAATASNGPEGHIAPQRAVWEIQQVMEKLSNVGGVGAIIGVRKAQAKGPSCSPIFAIDSGQHFFFATHYLHIDQADAFIAMIGLGSMASSISAIGAKLAAPERPVAVICGDGGFAMMAPEIATAVRHHLEIAFFVFNDQRLGMVEEGQRRIYGRTPSYDTGPLDIARMAAAVGARSVTVTRAGQVLALDMARLLHRGPLVVDVRIDRAVSPADNRRIAALAAQTDVRTGSGDD